MEYNTRSWSGYYVDYKFADERTMDVIMAVISTIATFLFGEFNLAMQYLIAANVIDVLTGIGKSGRYHRIGSKMFYAGVKKKVGFWILVFTAHMVDVVLIGEGDFAKSAIIMLLLGVEGTSITENLAAWGVPIPEFLSKYLIQIRERAGQGDTNVRDINNANIVDLDDKDGNDS